MRIASLCLPLLLVLGSCSLFSGAEDSNYAQPNSLMADEIETRVKQIPFQHRDELLNNLLWLAQTGETTIPTLLAHLQNDSPKVRSSCAWVLGRIRDRRTIPQLQAIQNDSNQTVRFEVARTLVVLGDLKPAPQLIEGLDSDKKEVRYLCHEALKTATGRDFGFDHLSDNETQRRTSVLGWRQWWSEYAGDPFFASNYQQKYQLQPAQPAGETQPGYNSLYQDVMQEPQGQGQQPQNPTPTPTPDAGTPNGDTPVDGAPTTDTPNNGTPNGGTPDSGTPNSGTPNSGTPNNGTPTDGTNGTPTNGTEVTPAGEPNGQTPGGTTPRNGRD